MDDKKSFARFTNAYFRAALWSSTDNSAASGGSPLDANYDTTDIDKETCAQMVDDCQEFWETAKIYIAMWGPDGDAQAGHDFWLTRNGHGCGFWETEWDLNRKGQPGAYLNKLATNFGSYYLFVNDDGTIGGCRG